MNSLAVILGLLYGLATAGMSYVVSMVASGLFARTFYRIYARVLIGICSVMLLVPLLRWVAPYPLAGHMLLTAAHYLTLAVLGYGVVRFNREFMKTLFAEKYLKAYFTFGTLVNAAVVTIIFLHVGAVPGGTGGTHVGPEHYAPFLMLLAAMIFHTDYHLKKATADGRPFSKFTFVGYAVSFVAIAMSTLPYFRSAVKALGMGGSLSEGELAFLENFSCAQTLLLALLLYGALVWYLESIPPLYLWLLVLCGEYHVLVTQWLIKACGAASWGLASLPLFMGVSALAHYFLRWDRKRAERESPLGGAAATAADEELSRRPRFVEPFQVVACGLGVTLILLTMWTRFATGISPPALLTPAIWLAATFVAYAAYYFLASIFEKNHVLIYAGALVAALAAVFGWEHPASPASAVALAGLSVSLAGLAWVGERFSLKREFRTSLSDSALVTAVLVLAIVACRHVVSFGSVESYRFDLVGLGDGVALFLIAISFVGCARQYRSCVPMYGTVVGIMVAAPTLCAASSFLACLAGEIIRRRVPPERAGIEEERLTFLGRLALPLKGRIPSLYAQPLSTGALPLSLLGLLISASHIVRGDLTISALLGAAASALVLALLTRTYPFPWLLALSILAGYFAAHSTIQRFVFWDWPTEDTLKGHLALAAAISLLGWMLATGYSARCEFWLRRIAEAQEAPLRERHRFYSGILHHVTAAIATVVLSSLLVMTLGSFVNGRPTQAPAPALALLTALLLAVFFGLSGAVYRSQLGSYLSLAALAIAGVSLVPVLKLPQSTEGALLAALGLVAALLSAALWGRRAATDADPAKSHGRRGIFPAPWERPPLPLAAAGLQLWLRPLVEFALLLAGLAFVHSLWFYVDGIKVGQTAIPTLVTFGLTSVAFLLCTRAYRFWGLYVLAIVNVYVAILAPIVSRDLVAGRQWPEVVGRQILIVAFLLAIAWAIATAFSAWCRLRLQRVAEPEATAIRQRREYYAGLLHHVTLAVASASIGILFVLPALAESRVEQIEHVRLFAGFILAGYFALSGATYRSRLQSYLCPIALCLFCYGIVEIFVEGQIRSPYAATLGTLALLLGVISWQLFRFRRASEPAGQESETHDFEAGIVPTAWDRPPLPLYTRGAELWAEPLAHASILLGFLAVSLAVVGWREYEPPVWSLSAVSLAAVVWLLATGTRRLGILRLVMVQGGLAGPGPARALGAPDLSDQQERIALYVLGLSTVYGAVHATVHTVLLRDPEFSAEVISWHLLVAASLSLVGWMIATGYSAWCNSRLARVATEGEIPIRDRLAFYAGWLHHVILVIATLDFIVLVCMTFLTLRESSRGTPTSLFAAGLLLTVFFGLSGAVYRTKLATYPALISLGTCAVDIAAVVPLPWPHGGPTDAAALALLGLCMTTIATGLWQGRGQPAEEHPPATILPSPWVRSPLPFVESSLRQLWAEPLAELGLAFAALSVLLVCVRWKIEEGIPLLATFYLTAAVLLLAARLYRTPVLTFMAVGSLWASLYPLLVLTIEEDPYVHSGTAVAALSLALWVASAIEERRVRAKSQAQLSEAGVGPQALVLVNVFERPLGRCAGILAVIAIAHSLFFWRVSGWQASQGPLVAACVGGALTLLLSARIMKLTQRVFRARLFVYLGCAALAGGSLAVTGSLPFFQYYMLGPVLGTLSLVFGFVGLVLLERAAAAELAKDPAGELARVYGEPIAHSALGLPVLAVLLAVVNSLPNVVDDITRLGDAPPLANAELGPLATTLLIASVVYLVSVRAMRDWRWLYSSAALGSLGILVFLHLCLPSGLFILTTVLLMNLLVVLARWIQGHADRVGSLLAISGAHCERPFYELPFLVSALVVLGQGIFFVLRLLKMVSPEGRFWPDPYWPWLVTPVLACGLFFHLFYLERRREFAHIMIAASLLGLLGAAASCDWLLTPDISVAVLGLLWGTAAAGLVSPHGDAALETLRLRMEQPERNALSQVVAGWAAGLLVFAMVITVPTWTQIEPGFPSAGLTILVAAAGFAIGGYLWRRVELAAVGAMLLLASVVAVLLFRQVSWEILPIAGLSAIVLAATYIAVSQRMRSLSAVAGADPFVAAAGSSLAVISAGFTVLAAVGTLLSVAWLEPSLPVAVTFGLIGACWLYMARYFKQELPVYLAEAALICTYLYVHHRLFGVPFGPDFVKAFGVVGLSFLLFGINILVSRGEAWEATVYVRPTYYSALLLPLALVAVTPWRGPDEKLALSLVMFTAASFYMLVARRGRALWALYVAAVLVNVALYIWIPTASEKTGLLQLYVIPAALTVLIFAHLHRDDLNRQALTGIRFAASGAILAVSTFEVFFASDNLLNFVAVLFLSLSGAIAGVLLRVRPFVYIGSAFLVINVLGQLGLQIHNQGGIIRAVILIAVGCAVMGMMIFFNIKRESLLRHYRSFVTDTRWE